MKEIRLSIIENHTDPTQDKRVEIHVTDAYAVLDNITHAEGDHSFIASRLKDLVALVLMKCGDTDKIEIGVDADGKLNPKSAFIAKGDGSGAIVPFAI